MWISVFPSSISFTINTHHTPSLHNWMIAFCPCNFYWNGILKWNSNIACSGLLLLVPCSIMIQETSSLVQSSEGKLSYSTSYLIPSLSMMCHYHARKHSESDILTKDCRFIADSFWRQDTVHIRIKH
jgi:hypothetical protein